MGGCNSPWLLDEGWEGETVHGYWMKGRCKLTSTLHCDKGDIVLVTTNTEEQEPHTCEWSLK